MILSLGELFDLAVMIIFLGIIFWDAFRLPGPRAEHYEPLREYSLGKKKITRIFGIPLRDFWNAVIIVAPAVAFHEMGHKFVALAFGMHAVFHANYFWLMLGLVLKLVHFPLIIFVPGYVQIMGTGTPLQSALTAFAGPAVNLLLWLGSLLLLRKKRGLSISQKMMLVISSKVNMFLFIFNMLPIPPFDGFTVFSNLFRAIF
jgi:Zn-dependent protease